VDNHYKDCEKYIFACAEALGVRAHEKISRGRVIRMPGSETPPQGAGKSGPVVARPNRPVVTWGGRQMGSMV
jgi:hypothetical protein